MKEKIIAYAKHYAKAYGLTVAWLCVVVVLSISLLSFDPYDQSFFYHASRGECHNYLGWFGATLGSLMVYLLGSVAYILPFFLLSNLLFIFGFTSVRQQLDRIIGSVCFIWLASALCRYHLVGFYEFSGAGGVIGNMLLKSLKSFDSITQGIILYTLLYASLVLMLRFAFLQGVQIVLALLSSAWVYVTKVENVPARMVRGVATSIARVSVGVWHASKTMYQMLTGKFIKNSGMSIMEFEQDSNQVDAKVDQILQDLFGKTQSVEKLDAQIQQAQKKAAAQEPVATKVTPTAVQAAHVAPAAVVVEKNYQLPDIEKMLASGNAITLHEANKAQLAEQSAILEEKLALFGIAGKVVRVHPGPVITLFEYRPQEHIKLSRIIGLEDDLAMALQALSIRIIAPIPGRDVVGFEVANKVRNPVLLSNIFHSAAWTKFKGSLPLILGEDTYGNHMVVDLAAMPHVLIAGSTGSGKSVALNCMLVSLLCSKDPQDLKLIIIDPKQIEFTAYEKVAHLLFPVVVDAKKSIPVLKWVVMTMEDRYEQMAHAGVKNIFEYQKLQQTRSDLEKMPFIVVIIDELADLMMTTNKEAEGLIARIAQMSRAAGIHMIVATQRPSVDVITGLIKVNFPNRISFKVTSKVDSRTILDDVGAERLLGKGDMLFIDAKDPHIRRVHGAYVSEREVAYLVSHIAQQQPANFLDINDYFAPDAQQSNSMLMDNDQELYQQVVDLLKDCDEVSISMIQRRFRIGFNRSARIIETLQARGLIMASGGGKMRRVVKDS